MRTEPDDDTLLAIDACWRAANYLTVCQLYLLDNVLLREPLRVEHIKPRLLGHWGTSPGLNLLYAHLNRVIVERDLDVLFLAGPGHGGPAVLASVLLEGSYGEVYPHITDDEAGLRAFARQFSTPGGVPSHVGPSTPGSIHEGGELGYVLLHAFGAVLDNPDLIAVAVVGDGEAETAPLEGSWKSIRFLNAARDGAVLPVLHLNGYKIGGPTVLGRTDDEHIRQQLEGHGYEVYFVEGDDPLPVHRTLARTLDACIDRIEAIQQAARVDDVRGLPRWPVIVLRTPKGWTGPKVVNGLPVEGTFRSHQVPLNAVREQPVQLAALEAWLRSYRPETLFDDNGARRAAIVARQPIGTNRMGRNIHAHGEPTTTLTMRPLETFAIDVPSPGLVVHESTRALGEMLREITVDNSNTFRLFCPDETSSNRLGAVFDLDDRCLQQEVDLVSDDHVTADGRVMEVLSEHCCEGWLEGYVLSGRHGLFATYEAFALIVASMTTQHVKWLEMCASLPWRRPVPSLNILLTSTCWRNDHNGFSHQGPGFMDTIITKKGTVARVYLPPDANCLLSVAEHCFASTDLVNVIVIDKQPQLQWLDLEAARAHCSSGASIWSWAGNEEGNDLQPDIVLACAGDIATLETLAAAAWLRARAPELVVRVVNVVDLMTLFTPREHPHGKPIGDFLALFTCDVDVVFSFHGYPGAVHQLLHGRPNAERFHVRGYKEEGTTTTPFDMVVLNETSRFHIVMDAVRRARRVPDDAAMLVAECERQLAQHRAYILEHFEDPAEIRDWRWPQA